MKKNNYVFTLVFSALCLAIGIAIKSLTFFIPIGIPVLKISFDGPAFRLAAVLFGPLYGGAVGALADYLGFFLTNKSGNAWLPFLTVTFALNMAGVGFLWQYFKKKSTAVVRIQYLTVVALILVYGVVSLVIGLQHKPKVLSLAPSAEVLKEFEQTAIKQIMEWEQNPDAKDLEKRAESVKDRVLETQKWLNFEQLKQAVHFREGEQTRKFETDVTEMTKALVKQLSEEETQLLEEIQTENLQEEIKSFFASAIKTAKTAENQMKQVREIRRQIQGSLVVLLVAFLGILIFFFNRWIAKNQEIKVVSDNFFQMFLSIMIPGLFFNWVNTYILFSTLFQNQKKDIFLFGFFRSAVNLVEVYYNTLLVLFLVVLLNPLLKKRGIFSIKGEVTKK